MMSAINSSVHTATNQTPFEVVFGKKFQLSGHANIDKTNENELHLNTGCHALQNITSAECSI